MSAPALPPNCTLRSDGRYVLRFQINRKRSVHYAHSPEMAWELYHTLSLRKARGQLVNPDTITPGSGIRNGIKYLTNL